ncbi:MAG: DUF998 domain-containing protein [Thermoplasmatales archaeon]
MKTLKLASLFGILGIVSAWLTIAISSYLNPWFSLEANALSDLGGGNLTANGHPAPTLPIVYDGGLIITSVLLIIFASLMVSISRNRIEGSGFSFFIISGIFLALIGIYHEGTYPHDFVSIWFFILASISYGTISVGVMKLGDLIPGSLMLMTILASWIIYALVPWKSVAEGEIFGITVVDALVLVHLFFFKQEG